MKIAHREIGPGHPPLVIAEIGINHGGDLAVAALALPAPASAKATMVTNRSSMGEVSVAASHGFEP